VEAPKCCSVTCDLANATKYFIGVDVLCDGDKPSFFGSSLRSRLSIQINDFCPPKDSCNLIRIIFVLRTNTLLICRTSCKFERS